MAAGSQKQASTIAHKAKSHLEETAKIEEFGAWQTGTASTLEKTGLRCLKKGSERQPKRKRGKKGGSKRGGS